MQHVLIKSCINILLSHVKKLDCLLSWLVDCFHPQVFIISRVTTTWELGVPWIMAVKTPKNWNLMLCSLHTCRPISCNQQQLLLFSFLILECCSPRCILNFIVCLPAHSLFGLASFASVYHGRICAPPQEKSWLRPCLFRYSVALALFEIRLFS